MQMKKKEMFTQSQYIGQKQDVSRHHNLLFYHTLKET